MFCLRTTRKSIDLPWATIFFDDQKTHQRLVLFEHFHFDQLVVMSWRQTDFFTINEFLSSLFLHNANVKVDAIVHRHITLDDLRLRGPMSVCIELLRVAQNPLVCIDKITSLIESLGHHAYIIIMPTRTHGVIHDFILIY